MLSRRYRVECGERCRGPRSKTVHSEYYSSMSECIQALKAKPMKANNQNCQYLQIGSLGGHDPEWLGFKDIDEMIEISMNGSKDMSILKEVVKYSAKAQVQDKDKLVKKFMDVAGGAVDVPTYLSGSPECMVGLKRAKIKSKVVKIAINCDVLCDISVSQYIAAGELIAKTVASLEKAGYRVRLLANIGNYNGGSDMALLSVVIKRENEMCNFRRMLMPLLSTAFFRGIGFNWISTLKGYEAGWGLGQRMDMGFQYDERQSKLAECMEKATGEHGFAVFSINDVIGMLDRNGQEKSEGFLRAKILDLS